MADGLQSLTVGDDLPNAQQHLDELFDLLNDVREDKYSNSDSVSEYKLVK